MKTQARLLNPLIRGLSLGFFILGLALCFICVISGETIGWKIPVMGITGGIVFLINNYWEDIALLIDLIRFPPSDYM
jgi:hypothetical protein